MRLVQLCGVHNFDISGQVKRRKRQNKPCGDFLTYCGYRVGELKNKKKKSRKPESVSSRGNSSRYFGAVCNVVCRSITYGSPTPYIHVLMNMSLSVFALHVGVKTRGSSCGSWGRGKRALGAIDAVVSIWFTGCLRGWFRHCRDVTVSVCRVQDGFTTEELNSYLKLVKFKYLGGKLANQNFGHGVPHLPFGPQPLSAVGPKTLHTTTYILLLQQKFSK